MQARALLSISRSGIRTIVLSLNKSQTVGLPHVAPLVFGVRKEINFMSNTSNPTRAVSASAASGSPSGGGGASFATKTCQDAHKLIKEGTHTYLDVRTPEEYAAGHPEGSINVPIMFKSDGGMSPNPDFLSQVTAAFPNKEVALCVGCLSGKRSEMASKKMAEAGFCNLVDVEGGYQAWSSAGLPTNT